MRKDLTAGLLALVLASGAVACSDDPTEPEESQLSAEEAQALAVALGEVGVDVFFRLYAGGLNTAAPAGMHPFGSDFAPQSHGGEHLTLTRSATAPCPYGGTVAAQVTLDIAEYPEEDRVTFEMEGTQTHDKCRVMARRQEFSINGDPNLSWSFYAETVGDDPVGDMSLDYSGAFRWETAGRQGRCTIDYSLRVNLVEHRATMEGSFCGATVTQTVNWTNA